MHDMKIVKTSGEVARELGISVSLVSLIRKLEYIGVTTPAQRLNRFRVYMPHEVEVLRKILEERREDRSRSAAA